MKLIDRIKGSLLGGAVGDALGAPIEFMSLAEIRSRFGSSGLLDYSEAYGRRGAITDDTQMTLFTAEGLLRAWVRAQERGICSAEGVIHHAYLRWLTTQNERPIKPGLEIGTDGWLILTRALHSPRAPGNTCLSALRASNGFGNPPVAHNNSKGCGGVMRVAPIGLFASSIGDDKAVFEMAANAASLTHGHPSGFLAAGYFAVIVAVLLRDASLPEALEAATDQLNEHEHREEVADAVAAAQELAARGHPRPEDIERLGGGWVAEEALAIAIACALTARDFRDGVLLAANHSGDSDSTASIAGNLLGAQFGCAAIPQNWLHELEMHDEIDRLATDLYAIAVGEMSAEMAWDAYPGW